jgi:hypothetical protein
LQAGNLRVEILNHLKVGGQSTLSSGIKVCRLGSENLGEGKPLPTGVERGTETACKGHVKTPLVLSRVGINFVIKGNDVSVNSGALHVAAVGVSRIMKKRIAVEPHVVGKFP